MKRVYISFLTVFLLFSLVINVFGYSESVQLICTRIWAVDSYGERVCYARSPENDSLARYWNSVDGIPLQYYNKTLAIHGYDGSPYWDLADGAEWSWLDDLEYYDIDLENPSFFPDPNSVVGIDASFFTNLTDSQYKILVYPLVGYEVSGGIDSFDWMYPSPVELTDSESGTLYRDDGSTDLGTFFKYDLSFRLQAYDVINYVSTVIKDSELHGESFDPNLVTIEGFRVHAYFVGGNDFFSKAFQFGWSRVSTITELSQDQYNNELNSAIAGTLDDINSNLEYITDYESGVDIDTPKNEFDSSSEEYGDLEEEIFSQIDKDSVSGVVDNAVDAFGDLNSYNSAFELVGGCLGALIDLRGITLYVSLCLTFIVVGIFLNNRFRGYVKDDGVRWSKGSRFRRS